MNKKILCGVLSICVALFTLFAPCTRSMAADSADDILTLSVTAEDGEISVSGTTGENVLACLIEIFDKNNKAILMETYPVSNSAFSAVLQAELTAGETYSAYVVNYNGMGASKEESFIPEETDPGTPGEDPGTPGEDPGTPGEDPGTPGEDPGTPGEDPGTPGEDPGTPGEDPGTPGEDPGTPGEDPGTPGVNPGTPGSNPVTPSNPSSSDQKQGESTSTVSEPAKDQVTAEENKTITSTTVTATAPKITEVETTEEADEVTVTEEKEDNKEEASVTGKTLITPEEEVTVEVESDISEAVSKEDLAVLEEQVSKAVDELISLVSAGDSKASDMVSKETAENIKKALNEGKQIAVEIKADVIDEKNVPAEDKKLIEEAEKEWKKDNLEVVCYLDLEVLLKTNDGDVLGNYNEFSGKLKFTIEAPKTKLEDGKKYVVIRVHEGETAILDVTVNADGTLSFETDSLSSYALSAVNADSAILTVTTATIMTKKSNTALWIALAAGVVLIGALAVILANRAKNKE